MHDVARRCDMNYVRSKDAQKQLARTSLSSVFQMLKFHVSNSLKRHFNKSQWNVCSTRPNGAILLKTTTTATITIVDLSPCEIETSSSGSIH